MLAMDRKKIRICPEELNTNLTLEWEVAAQCPSDQSHADPGALSLPAEQDLRLIRVTRDTKHIRNQVSIKAENGTQCQHRLSHHRSPNHLFLN